MSGRTRWQATSPDGETRDLSDDDVMHAALIWAALGFPKEVPDTEAKLAAANAAVVALADGLREGITSLYPDGSLGCDHRLWRAGVPIVLAEHADAIQAAMEADRA